MPFLPSNCNKNQGESKMNRLFDTKMMAAQRQVMANLDPTKKASYLQKEIGTRLANRLDDIKQPTIFGNALYLGGATRYFIQEANSSRIGKITEIDNITTLSSSNRFDACFSNLHLHQCDNLQDTFTQIQKVLEPDGLFMVSAFGSESLYQLRQALQLAEVERYGGIGLHIHPMMRMEDLGNLYSSTKFNLITVDYEDITISYPSMIDVMDDLSLMGESNVLLKTRHALGRKTLLAADSIYRGNFMHA